MKTFAKIRFYYGASIISLVAGGIMVPLLMIVPKKSSEILHYFNKIIIFLIGGRIKEHGKLDKSANMVISNHQGIIDIIALEASQNVNFQWVAKKQLFDTPWFGFLLKIPKMIEVDRENKSGLIKLLADAKETVQNHKDRVIAIFPEGTRTNKQKLLSFKAGARIVAEKLELTIQPIVITNSKRLLNEHNQTAHSTTVHITYLEPFKVSQNNKGWYEKIRQKMQNVIDEEEKTHKRER